MTSHMTSIVARRSLLELVSSRYLKPEPSVRDSCFAAGSLTCVQELMVDAVGVRGGKAGFESIKQDVKRSNLWRSASKFRLPAQ